jgi:radical SAM protein with 4Fe4S-binding SPASM domain
MRLFSVIEIETHNRCTRRCWFCKYGQIRQDSSKTVMSDELIEKIADNLHDLDFKGRISPIGINEPLLDPRLPEIIRSFRAKCPQAFISMVTNGDLLTEEIYQSLRSGGLDGLQVSIYDDKAWHRLAHYAHYPQVRLMDMRRPESRIENRGGGVRQARFTPDIDIRRPCLRPFHMLVIKSSGEVCLCCADMYGDVVLGNVADQRLEEIWDSEGFRHYRAKLAITGRVGLQLCQDCSHEGRTCAQWFPFEDEVRSYMLTVLIKFLKLLTPKPLYNIMKRKVLLKELIRKGLLD